LKYFSIIADCEAFFTIAPKDSRKEFAFWVKDKVPSYYQKFLFNLFDGKQPDERKVYTLVGERDGISGDTQL